MPSFSSALGSVFRALFKIIGLLGVVLCAWAIFRLIFPLNSAGGLGSAIVLIFLGPVALVSILFTLIGYLNREIAQLKRLENEESLENDILS